MTVTAREMNEICAAVEHLNNRLSSLEAVAENVPREQGLKELEDIALKSCQIRQRIEAFWNKIGEA